MWRLLKCVLALVGLAAVAPGPADAQDYPRMRLKLAHFLTPAFAGSQVDRWFADEIKARSGGNIEIEIFWAGSLGKPTELLDLVKSGAVELAAIGTSYYPSELPLSGIVQAVPRVFRDNEEAVRISSELFATNANLQAELRRNNVVPLFWHSLAGYRPLCKSKVEKTADFKGLKMRAWGEFVPQLWASVGATPVNVLPGELYEALQRGSLDCVFWAYDLLYAGRLHEVAKYTTDIDFGAFVNYPIMANADVWAKWPESVKKLFREVGAEATERDVRLVRELGDKAAAEMVAKSGVTIVKFLDPQELAARLPDLAAAWVRSMAGRGLETQARELIDAIKARQK